MAVKIRMRQQGRKNRQTFRLVVTDSRNPRDGKYVETLGSYDPHHEQNNFSLNAERLKYWLARGAQISERAERLVKGIAPEVIGELRAKEHQARLKQVAKRRKKKVVVAAAPAPKTARAPAAKKAKKQDAS